MVALTKFESDIIKLNWACIRLQSIYIEFPKIQGKTMITEMFRSTIREMIILQLDNFLKIREELRKEPSFKKFDECVSSLWKPIIKIKTPMKLIRNNYVAHIQEDKVVRKPFQVMIQEIIDKYQLPTSLGYWVMLAGCVMYYEGFANVNFKKEWDVAEKKYRTMSPMSTKYGLVGMANYESKIESLLQKCIKSLRSNGYKDIR